jgi:hypothetical protein
MDIYAQFVPESQRRAAVQTMQMVNERIERARLAESVAVN